MDAEVLQRLDAIDQRLARLDLIESHLLDLLLPSRKAFLRSPQAEPPAVVADGIQKLLVHTSVLHAKLDALTAQVVAAASKPETFEESSTALEATPPPAAEATGA